MKRNIIAFCIFCLCTGSLAACNDFDNPAIPDDEAPEVTPAPVPPAIDPSWNLVQMPDEGGQNPRVFVYKDKKYDALFTRTLGWNGGDGVLTTALPGGHVFWSFNDSFYGVVDGKTRARGSCSFPRNSLMIQKGATIASGQESDDDLVWLADYVQTDNPSGERYYQARTHIRHPKASLSDAEIQKGEIDQDYCYWAGDAVVYDDPAHGKILQMLWTGVEPGSLKNIDGCLREYSLEGEPGDGQYMSVLSTDYNFKSDGLGYGSTMFEDTEGGHIYLYTTKQVNLVSRVLVARTETLDLGSPWSYYIRDLSGDYHWQSSVPSNEEMERSYITAESGSMPWVFEKDGVYYMCMEAFPFGRDIYLFRSQTPYGPFTDRTLLFTLPATLDKLGSPYHQRWYMINLHPALSRQGELVFSTNSDPANFWDNFNRVGSADFYRPYFFRVYTWEHVYDSDDDSGTGTEE